MSDALMEMLRLYARKGVAEWKNASGELRSRALSSLGPQIADDEAEANQVLYTAFANQTPETLRFIPMPMLGIKNVDRGFFIPMLEFADEEVSSAHFDLLLLVQGTNLLAFRFEPPDDGKHGYPHAQLSRSLIKRTKPIDGVPPWMPDTCPAFPFAANTPLRLFLAMALSVHGHKQGVLKLIVDLFTADGANQIKYYVNETGFVIGTRA